MNNNQKFNQKFKDAFLIEDEDSVIIRNNGDIIRHKDNKYLGNLKDQKDQIENEKKSGRKKKINSNSNLIEDEDSVIFKNNGDIIRHKDNEYLGNLKDLASNYRPLEGEKKSDRNLIVNEDAQIFDADFFNYNQLESEKDQKSDLIEDEDSVIFKNNGDIIRHKDNKYLGNLKDLASNYRPLEGEKKSDRNLIVNEDAQIFNADFFNHNQLESEKDQKSDSKKTIQKVKEANKKQKNKNKNDNEKSDQH